jgi:hypothetical protein
MTLSLLDIRENQSVVDALRVIPFEFDMVDYDQDKSWIAFEPRIDFAIIAGDYCGGVYLLCEVDTTNSGVFHISSEAKASRIGGNLQEAIEHILTIPNWHDIAHEDLDAMREHVLRKHDPRNSDWAAARDHVGAELGLDVTTDYTERLHRALAVGCKMKVLVNGEPTINGFLNNWDELTR